MGARITWDDSNDGPSQEDGFRIYRSGSPISAAALPAPIATLGPNARAFDDYNELTGDLYYAVGAYKGGFERIASQPPIYIVAGIGGPQTASLTIAAGKVSADLVSYPVVVDLSLITDVAWWSSIFNSDGGDLRVTDNSDVALPFDLIDINTAAKTGLLVVRTDVATASPTTIKFVANANLSMSMIPAADVGGQNQTWGGFDAVYLFRGDLTDRTGKGHTLTTNAGSPNYTTGFEFSLGGGTDSTSAAWDANVYDASWVDDDNVVMMVGCSIETDTTGWQFALATLPSRTASTNVIMLGQRDSDSSFSLRYDSTSQITGTANEAVAGNDRLLHSELTGGQIEFWINGVRVTSASTTVKRKGYLQVGFGTNAWRGNIGIVTMRRGTLSSQHAAADRLNYDPTKTFFR